MGATVDCEDDLGRAPLMWASSKNHGDVVMTLLKNGASVNKQCHEGNSALHVTSQDGSYIMRLLINHGASIDLLNNDREDPLLLAARDGHAAAVMVLLEQGTSFKLAESRGESVLVGAARNGHFGMVLFLLERGASIDFPDKTRGESPLIGATRKGHVAVVMLLLERGASIDLSDNVGWTSLIHASSRDDKEMVAILLEKGASVDKQSSDGITALRVAGIEASRLLIAKGASIDLADNEGNTRLSTAAIPELMVKAGGSIDWANHAGLTALHRNCNDEMRFDEARVLVELGANVNLQTKEDLTALHMAPSYEFVKLFLENGGATDLTDKNGDTVLNLAAKTRGPWLSQPLLENGASSSVDVPDNYGMTPLISATVAKNFVKVSLLLAQQRRMASDVACCTRRPQRYCSENGANVNYQLPDGTAALHIAWQKDQADVLRLPVHHGADINIAYGKSNTSLICAAIDRKTVKLMLELGATVDLDDDNGTTPLMLCVE